MAARCTTPAAAMHHFGGMGAPFQRWLCTIICGQVALFERRTHFAAKFLEKAFSAGVRFTPEQVLEMVAMVDQSLLSKMAEQTTVPFNREQLEEIYMMIDDSSFQKISRRSRIDVFDDVKELLRQAAASSAARPKKKGGLLSAVAAFAAGAAVAGHLNKKHDGHCDGDCANCPPHYGYRYGRWYYGKGHQYGCEFGVVSTFFRKFSLQSLE